MQRLTENATARLNKVEGHEGPAVAEMREGPFQTYATVKAEVVQPKSNQFKSIASSLKEKYGFDLTPQVDLMYVRSILVTSAANDNDDLFLKDEMWNARHSPMLKPANWQHQDKDILGVVYSVQARDSDGNVIDFDCDEPPKGTYEFVTEAAVFKLIHEDRAKEIAKRAKSGSLFVSMEAWFDDYDYAMVDESGDVVKVIARNRSTAFLDSHLRAFGGTGKYESYRLCRALREITFGGYGFVDVPANKPSIIEEVTEFKVSSGVEDPIFSLLRKIESDDLVPMEDLSGLDDQTVQTEENVLMTQANAHEGAASRTSAADLDAAAQKAADRVLADQKAREEAQAAERQREALESKASDLETQNTELSDKVSGLETALGKKDEDIQRLEAELKARDEKLDELVATFAGATGDTPSEIASIDSAGSGEEAFAAKIAWIGQSRAALQARASQADELEERFEEASKVVREGEIMEVFAGRVDSDELTALVEIGLSKSDADYDEWIAEKKVLASRMPKAESKKGEMPFPPKGKKDDKKDEEKDAKASHLDKLAALLGREKAGQVWLQPESLGLSSGVTPGAPGLSTPRHKIAGSAQDAESILASAQPQDQPNLAAAGSSDSDDSGEQNAFRSLATLVVEGANADSNSDQGDSAEKPSFDPVRR